MPLLQSCVAANRRLYPFPSDGPVPSCSQGGESACRSRVDRRGRALPGSGGRIGPGAAGLAEVFGEGCTGGLGSVAFQRAFPRPETETTTLRNDVSRTRGVRPGRASRRLPKGRDHRVLPFPRKPDTAFPEVHVPRHVARAFFTDGRRCECARRRGFEACPGLPARSFMRC